MKYLSIAIKGMKNAVIQTGAVYSSEFKAALKTIQRARRYRKMMKAEVKQPAPRPVVMPGIETYNLGGAVKPCQK